jgi:hypothetical protein
VHNFYNYAADKEVVRDELALLSELPLRLRIKVMSQLYAGEQLRLCWGPSASGTWEF